MTKKNKVLVIIEDDKSKVNLSINILKYLNSINRNNEYYFLSIDKSKRLRKYIKKNLLKINFNKFESVIKKNEYDWLLSIWSSNIYSKSFLSKFKNNLNLHPSYLPYNRGKDPYCWSIYNNTPMGVTIHQMNHKIDKGKIYVRKRIFVKFPYTAYDIYLKSLREIKELFIAKWKMIKSGKIKLKKINHTKELNLRKNYLKHTYLDLDINRVQNKNTKEFIYKILSCDFKDVNSLKIKLNQNIYETKILLKKSK